jgi:hypothetical protein
VTVVVAVETLVVVAGGELVEVDEHAASISAATTAMPSFTILTDNPSRDVGT